MTATEPTTTPKGPTNEETVRHGCTAGTLPATTAVKPPPSTRSSCSARRVVALLVVGWATSGGGAGKIGHLFDRVIDAVTGKL